MSSVGTSGFFKAGRSDTGPQIIRANHCAFVLLYIIAHRARWRDGFNQHGLSQGEAMLGDYAEYDLSERQYRTAKHFLEKHGFATFKATNKGTIATLVNTEVFDVFGRQGDEQNDRQATDARQASDRQATTNEEGKKGIREETKQAERVHSTDVARPSLAEILARAQMRGVAEWKATDWFNEMEGAGWLDYAHRPIIRWQAVFDRVAVKWEADGRPMSPPANSAASRGKRVDRNEGIPNAVSDYDRQLAQRKAKTQ